MSEVQLTLDDALQLAIRQHQAGNTAGAEYICNQILSADPTHAGGLRLQRLLADPSSASDWVANVPADSADAHGKLAIELTEQGRFDQAEVEYWRAIELDPHNPGFQVGLGKLLMLRGQPPAAISAYSATIARFPLFAPAYSARAVALAQHQLLDEALADHRKAIELAPSDVGIQLDMAATLGAVGDVAQATACCRRALEIDPASADAWECLGKVLMTNGRFEEAANAFDRCLEIQPRAEVVQLRGFMLARAEQRHILELQASFNNAQLPAKERATIGFALGKMLDESDRFDEAFAVYAQANALFKELSAQRGSRFEIAELRDKVDWAINTFTRAFFEQRAGWGDRSEMPVFVVGMPRSGTTLVEQILASHSKVFGAGERADIAMIRSRLAYEAHTDSPVHWTQEAVLQEARSHLKRISGLGHGPARVVDKTTANLLNLGLIAILFPQARIIFCQRDARDTCLSCFFQLFGRNGQMFSYDLADCARQHNQFDRLASHWQQVLPLRMLVVQYEELIADSEGESRRLVEFLDLPWDPNCLEFHKNHRPVLTSSVWQVRQPIYSRSVARWKHYEKHLAGLEAALRN